MSKKDAEKWVALFCPKCNQEACKVNINSKLPGKIEGVICQNCGKSTRDWASWIKEDN